MTEQDFMDAIKTAEAAGLDPARILRDYYRQTAAQRIGQNIK
jgi:hypothetical protein